MKNILVTGGTGFVGSHLLYKLTLYGYTPVAIKRKSSNLDVLKNIFCSYKNKTNLFEKIHWINADLNNKYDLNKLLIDIDTVFHCAALVSFNKREKDLMLQTNYIGTKNLVNLSLQNSVSKFCYVSSIATLSNNISDILVNETCWFSFDEKKSTYAISKHLAEMEVWRGFEEGLSGFIINPSLIIGPGDKNSLFGNAIKKIKYGTFFYPKGGTGLIDVRDVVDILIKLEKINVNHERYIINSENLSFKEVIALFAKNMNSSKPRFAINNNIILLFILLSKLINPYNTLSFDMIDFLKSQTKYSNEKIKNTLNYNFIPISESIKVITQES